MQAAPRHFTSAAAFRAWLERHHARRDELWIAFYKKHAGKPGLTYPEAVEEALAYGWIDGIKKRVDEASYTHRFTPRKPDSSWSNVNTKRIAELITLKHVAAPGLKAFTERDRGKAQSAREPLTWAFDAACKKAFKANAAAWTFFRAQPPGYQRLSEGFVMHAKKDETRQRRLAQLIAASAKGQRMQWM